MKLAKGVLFFIGIFAVSLILCAAVGLTGLSYYAVNEMVKATGPESPKKTSEKIHTVKAAIVSAPSEFADQDTDPAAGDPNLRSLVTIGSSYKAEFAVFDQMLAEIAKKKSPEFCHIICNPSYLDQERLKEERSHYLKAYYKEHGMRALEDPGFRMKLAEIHFLSGLFPHSFRELLSEIESLHGPNSSEQSRLSLAVKLEMSVLREMPSMSFKLQSMKAEADKLANIRGLVKSCQQGTLSPKAVRTQCETLVQ